MTLTDFLLARIAEDEGSARLVTSVNVVVAWEEPPVPKGVDLRLFDAARILAECEAKRRIVGLHSLSSMYPEDGPTCNTCGVTDGWYNVAWPCPTLRALAAVYADHPDYREEWKV